MPRLLVTAGGTREPIDAVRFLGNRSSGRLGVAVAADAARRGWDVTLLLAAASVDPPAGVEVARVETTSDLAEALSQHWPTYDALVMAAAVADFRPVHVTPGKLRRSGRLTLDLEPTPDLLADACRRRRPGQVVVGFSLDEDTPAARDRAARKLATKGVDLLVFNPLTTMDAADVRAELLWPGGRVLPVGPADKPAFAKLLLDHVARLLPDP